MRHLITAATALLTTALLTLACGTAPPTPPINSAAPHAPPPVAARYIATIAVDDYADAPPLYGAVHDADAITTAFRDRLGFRDAIDGIPLALHDNAATRDGIEAFTHRANGPLAQLPDDALLVLYVALHGQSTRCGAHACGEVLPRDRAPGEGYDVATLLARLDQLPVRHVLLLLDTCDSGMALGGPPLYTVDHATLREPSPHRQSRKVITAAALDQDADDGDQDRRGRFAATLLDGLAGEADLFPDGNLLFIELATYLQIEVARRSETRQQPEFGGFLRDGRGSPSLGPLDPPRAHATGTLAALMTEARQHLDADDARRAQGVLARYLLVRSSQAWAARRAVEQARTLAGQGRHGEAIATLDAFTRDRAVPSPAGDVALAQYTAQLARAGQLDPSEVERREDAATEAAVAASEVAPGTRGALLDTLGALAASVGAERVAAETASAARPLVDDAARPAVTRNATTAVEEPASDPLPATAHRPAMVPIQPGAFIMGSPETEAGRFADEQAHPVELTRGFWMAQTEVTQAQYTAVSGANPSYFKGTADDARRPVESVSWRDAAQYCNALSALEGLDPAYLIQGEQVTWDRDAPGYRLPTEAEWEYAARAGTVTATYAGDLDIRGERDAPILDAIAWYGGNSGSTHPEAWDSSGLKEKQYPHTKASTHPVGQKRPNAWGLYDMLGNVREWTWDWHTTTPSASAPRTDPAGPPRGVQRVVRGGSFVVVARGVRAASRIRWHPVDRHQFLGFRPVRPAPRARP